MSEKPTEQSDQTTEDSRVDVSVTLGGASVKAEVGGISICVEQIIKLFKEPVLREKRNRHRLIAALWELISNNDFSDRRIMRVLYAGYGKGEGRHARVEGFSRTTLKDILKEARALQKKDREEHLSRKQLENNKT